MSIGGIVCAHRNAPALYGVYTVVGGVARTEFGKFLTSLSAFAALLLHRLPNIRHIKTRSFPNHLCTTGKQSLIRRACLMKVCSDDTDYQVLGNGYTTIHNRSTLKLFPSPPTGVGRRGCYTPFSADGYGLGRIKNMMNEGARI